VPAVAAVNSNFSVEPRGLPRANGTLNAVDGTNVIPLPEAGIGSFGTTTPTECAFAASWFLNSITTLLPAGTVIVSDPCDAPLKFHPLLAEVAPAVIVMVARLAAASHTSHAAAGKGEQSVTSAIR
jgi:hypothetical protein